jgi:hypothetical protein
VYCDAVVVVFPGGAGLSDRFAADYIIERCVHALRRQSGRRQENRWIVGCSWKVSIFKNENGINIYLMMVREIYQIPPQGSPMPIYYYYRKL